MLEKLHIISASLSLELPQYFFKKYCFKKKAHAELVEARLQITLKYFEISVLYTKAIKKNQDILLLFYNVSLLLAMYYFNTDTLTVILDLTNEHMVLFNVQWR